MQKIYRDFTCIKSGVVKYSETSVYDPPCDQTKVTTTMRWLYCRDWD